jgi:hypothetical protein
MALTKNKNFGTPIGESDTSKDKSQIKRVVDIILGRDHPKYTGPDSIGTIFFTDEKSQEKSKKPYSLPTAKPINKYNFAYPLKGELVQVIIGPGNDYYEDMGGNPSFTTNYYYPALNIHGNTHNNALPIVGKKPIKNNYNTNISPSSFSFEKEFKSINREVARSKLDNYLRKLGYTSGTNDSRAPKYDLFQAADGSYIYRLEESEENKIKLGNYFKENPNQQSLIPSEGDVIFEGRNGQRIRFGHTGPEGDNIFSRNVTDIEDQNTSIGDPFMAISIGNRGLENPNIDNSSIYLISNQSCPVVASSLNIDSLNSTYKEVEDPLVEIAKAPPVVIPEAPSDITQEVDFEDEETPTVTETTPSPPPPPLITEDIDDPVFAALDVAEEEGLIELKEYHFEDPREYENPSIDSTPTNEYPSTNFIADELGVNIDEVTTWDPQYTDTRINTLHPLIRRPAKELVLRCQINLGINLRVSQALRTIAEQDALYAKGRTVSGDIVTNAKGGSSYHNYGLAFDLVEITSGGGVNYDYNHAAVSNIGKSLGFEWGGDWKSIVDKPHYQMVFGKKTSELKTQLDNDLANGTALEGKYPNIT